MNHQQIVDQAQQTACAIHGPPGQPCPGGGACLRRCVRACTSRLIGPADLRDEIRAALTEPEVNR